MDKEKSSIPILTTRQRCLWIFGLFLYSLLVSLYEINISGHSPTNIGLNFYLASLLGSTVGNLLAGAIPALVIGVIAIFLKDKAKALWAVYITFTLGTILISISSIFNP